MKVLNDCSKLFLVLSIMFTGISCKKQEVNEELPSIAGSSVVFESEDSNNLTTLVERSSLPTPKFHVMDPNWGSGGQTCFNCLLELGVIGEPGAPGFIRYEWEIRGATLESNFNEGRYVFVRTGRPNTSVYFAVRGVYQSGVTPWVVKTGRTINGSCNSGGSGTGGSSGSGGTNGGAAQ